MMSHFDADLHDPKLKPQKNILTKELIAKTAEEDSVRWN